jgi:hypothetical protein
MSPPGLFHPRAGPNVWNVSPHRHARLRYGRALTWTIVFPNSSLASADPAGAFFCVEQKDPAVGRVVDLGPSGLWSARRLGQDLVVLQNAHGRKDFNVAA